MDLLKEIGAILGFVAFGGLAILAFLTFQQARHLRRLRDWAGRQPERAAAEAEAVAERAGEVTIPSIGSDGEADKGPSRLDHLRGEVAVRFEDFDRRSPVDARILLAGLLAVLIGVGVATSGFGLLGEDGSETETTATSAESEAEAVEVAVLNGTTPEGGGTAVPEVAKRAGATVEELGYELGAVETAPGSFPTSVVMFEDGSKAEAKELAAALEPALSTTEIEAMTAEVEALAGGAPLTLVVGIDDQGI